jgi:hypothetical protein
LVEDKQLNEKGVYLLKYQVKAGNGDIFQAPVEYNQSVMTGEDL